MKTATIQLEALSCPSCMQKIEGALKALDGVEKKSVSVSFNASRAKLSFDETRLGKEDLENAIGKLGFEVLSTKIGA